MVRWWRLALLALAGAVTAVAAAVATVAGNVLTGSTAPRGFPGLQRHPWWWMAGATAAVAVAWLLAWAAPRWYEQGRGNTGRDAGPSLLEIADGLAARLRSQWAREAEARRLNDPYPLPVTWAPATPPLAGDLEALKRLAVSGAGWSAQGREHWARGPGDLTGGGDRKLADVLAAVPTGRLVVLGEPGSGKTMLMVGLVLDLLHPGRRGGGYPVPVLASLASWDPASQDLHGWLAATLITGYPDLAAPAPPGSAGRNRFEALLEAGLILPVLDGLDEIPEHARPATITRINEELKPGESAVVTCRTEQYKDAVSPADGQGVALRAAAVQLNTLGFGEVASYLREDAGPAQDRWDFLNTLSAESPTRSALATPLMTALARTVYNPRPDERAGDLRHPGELRGFADRAAVEAHLFDAFIPAAYRPPAQGRWTARQAEPWLMFLARHLEQTIGRPDLAWWQLRPTARPEAFRFLVGLVSGLVFGLVFGSWGGLAAGLAAGLLFGLASGLASGLEPGRDGAPARGIRIGASELGVGLVLGLVLGLVSGLVSGLVFGSWGGLVFGLVFGLVSGLVTQLESVPGNLVEAASPRAVLARDRRVALVLMFGLVLMLVLVLVFGLKGVLGLRLVFGLVCGLMFCMSQIAWPSHMLIRGWLAFHRHLPWLLMSFLADAHRRGY